MKRRGFTLIELMVVIAIIIILAAIAIPNYLSMTKRAKRSRVASDFAALATAFETYRTDWNQYPVFTSGPIITNTGAAPVVALKGGGVGEEVSGVDTAGAKMATGVNATGTTAAGEKGPIQYMTANILKSMLNPYSSDDADQYVYQGTNVTGKTHWLLIARTEKGVATNQVYRTDEQTNLTDDPLGTAAVIPTD